MARPWLPSPDGALVEIVDRIVAVPQQRGIPLPLALSPLPFLSPVGMLAMAAFLAWLGFAPFAFLIGLVGVVDVVRGASTLRTRLRDAQAWSPSVARRYRQEAFRARETFGLFRMAEIALTATAVSVTLVVAMRDVPDGVFEAALGYLLWVLGHLARSYGACALPRDPDLRQRVPLAA